MARAVDAARERPKAAVSLAALLICAGLMLGPIREVVAYTFDTNYQKNAYNLARDSDGKVPEYEANLNGGARPPYPGRERVTFGLYTPIFQSAPQQATYVSLEYDWLATDYCNVSHSYVTAHERAHSRGWAHGKENFQVNKAYYKGVPGGCQP